MKIKCCGRTAFQFVQTAQRQRLADIKDFLHLQKNKNPELITFHCFSYHEALMIKSSDEEELCNVHKTVIEMIKYIKT